MFAVLSSGRLFYFFRKTDMLSKVIQKINLLICFIGAYFLNPTQRIYKKDIYILNFLHCNTF